MNKKFGPLNTGKTGKPLHPKATEPWKNDQPEPWRMDYMKTKERHSGFRPRFVPKHKIEQRLMQGWVIADSKDYGGTTYQLPGEASDTSQIRRREMVLMEIPEERAKGIERRKEALLQKRESDRKRAFNRDIGGSAIGEFKKN